MERGSQDVVTCAQEDSTMIEESCPPMDLRLLGTGGRRADCVLGLRLWSSTWLYFWKLNLWAETVGSVERGELEYKYK